MKIRVPLIPVTKITDEDIEELKRILKSVDEVEIVFEDFNKKEKDPK
mgnify:CR=1 FL=1